MDSGTLPAPPRHPRRLAFLGTPREAVPSLDALVAEGYELAGVITAADRRRGRRQVPTPTPVKEAAEGHGLRIAHDLAALEGWGVQAAVVVAYGRLIPSRLLKVVPMINVHFSLLPRWRGAAPVERAILAGDEVTGVCVMAVTEELDRGDIYARRELEIGEGVSATELRSDLAGMGADLLVETLRTGLDDPVAQEGEPSYATKISTDDRRIDWHSDALFIDRVVRVGGAWTTVNSSRLKVNRVSPQPPQQGDPPPGVLDGERVGTGQGTVLLKEVQPEGRAAVGAADWLRGARLEPGQRLGQEL